MRCESCGANLPPLTATCPYCNATTAAGAAQARERAAWEQQKAAHAAHVEQHTRAQHEYMLRQRAQKLPLWGIGALFVPCLGIPALAAFLTAWSVRAEAKRHGLPVPGQVTTAFALSGISFALSAVLVVMFVIDSAEQDERLAQLEKSAAPLLSRPTLTQPEACLAAEYLVERDGHQGTSGLNIDAFRCDGKLLSTGPEKLLLERFVFKSAGDVKEFDVCFVRRARWTIDRMVAPGTSCDAPLEPEGSASAESPNAPGPRDGRGRPKR